MTRCLMIETEEGSLLKVFEQALRTTRFQYARLAVSLAIGFARDAPKRAEEERRRPRKELDDARHKRLRELEHHYETFPEQAEPGYEQVYAVAHLGRLLADGATILHTVARLYDDE